MKWSIRARLIATVVGLAIVPLLLLGAVLSWQSFLVEETQLKEFQKKLTALASESLSLLFHEREQTLISMMRSHYSLDMSLDEQIQVVSTFLSASKDEEHGYVFDEIAMLDAQGNELFAVSSSHSTTGRTRRDWSIANKFRSPFMTGKIHYGPVRFAELTGEPLMEWSLPLIDRRTQVVGRVLVATVKLNFMWHQISHMRFGESGITFLVNQDGRLIGHPNPSVILGETRFTAPEAPSFMTGTSGNIAVIAAEKIHSHGQNMTLVTEISASEALRPLIRSVMIIGAALLLTLLGAIVLGLILVRQIVSPIESLARTAKSISAGDLSQIASFQRMDELGDLATAFNDMTSQLVDTIRDVQAEKDFVRSTIENLSHPFYVIDTKDYTVRLANSAANFGVLTEESQCYRLTHHSDKPCTGAEHPCMIREIKKARTPMVLRHVHHTDDGTSSIFEVHGYPIFDGEGEVKQVIEYSVDISEKLSLKEQLLHAQKLEAIGSLASGVAHDFNNLLQVISAHADLVKNSIEPDSKVNESMKTVLHAVRQATGVTRSLLTFSHKLRSEKTPVDLCSTVDQAEKMLRHSLPASIELLIETDCEPPPWVNADSTQLQQIILNLSVNARDAMPDGGTLRISVSPPIVPASSQMPSGSEAPVARIVVSDTGTGISPAIQKRIFDPFFTTKEREQGTGLGLSITHGIVKDHEGRIEVESRVGVGSTFTTYLPCTSQTRDIGPDQRETAPPKAHGELILLAEDNRQVRDAITTTLVSAGCEVVQAADGDAFLEILQRYGQVAQLLILDVDLPKRTGLTCLREIRAQGSRTPAIVITASPDIQVDEQLDEYTILLPKPFPVSELQRIAVAQMKAAQDVNT